MSMVSEPERSLLTSLERFFLVLLEEMQIWLGGLHPAVVENSSLLCCTQNSGLFLYHMKGQAF